MFLYFRFCIFNNIQLLHHYDLLHYYININTQLINHNSSYLDDLILLAVVGFKFILWFVGLYGHLKNRKMNREGNV